MSAPTAKDTNPKEEFGDAKIPFHLFPETASAAGALAFLEGALKYGRMNYRPMGVRATTYYNACRRHMNAWLEGEDTDPDSGLPHLSKALACVAILIDATAQGNLKDDRNYPGGYLQMVKQTTEAMQTLKEKYADWETPHHWTIKDARPAPQENTPSGTSREELMSPEAVAVSALLRKAYSPGDPSL